MSEKKNKNQPEGGTWKFKGQNQPDDGSGNVNLANIYDKLAEQLAKSVKPQTVDNLKYEGYDKSKGVYSDSREMTGHFEGVITKGWRRLQDNDAEQIAQIDPYISAIISTRCSQVAACTQPSESKFDKGCRVMELDPLNKDDFDTDEAFEAAQNQRKVEMKSIMHWVQHCGTSNEDAINAAYAESADHTWKHSTLRQYAEAMARNILTFGRAHTIKMRNSDGLLIMFRPGPTQTILNVDRLQVKVSVGTGTDVSPQSIEDAKELSAISLNERPTAYKQINPYTGKQIALYTENDMSVAYWQKQALWGQNGYPYSPIELAIYMVFIHQNTLGYLRNQFIKGLASKGILMVESTNPAVDISDTDLENFRNEFQNFAMRNDNSAVTPILAGPFKLSFTALNPTVKDMEFLQVEEHVIRALCSSFQISPEEMGYGNLSVGQGGLTQANKQQDITKGEERGLRHLLDLIYEQLNEMIQENFPEAAKKYRLVYTGVGDDTRDSVVQRNTAELQTTATMSSLWAASERTDPFPFGGDVPLAAAFHQFVVPKMTYGEFREYFFGDEGAKDRKEFQFLIDPNLNQALQTLLNPPPAPMAPGQPPQDGTQPPQDDQGQPQEEQAEEPMQESRNLREEFLNTEALTKSVGNYFGNWLNISKD